MILRGFEDSYMQILLLRNELLQTTTIILHRTLPSELNFLRRAVANSLLERISLHPVFIFALVMNLMYRIVLPSISGIVADAVAPLNREANNVDIEAESKLALHRHHMTAQCTADIEQALHEISKMKLWCKMFDSCGNSPKVRELYKSAGLILLDHLSDLEDLFIHANIENKKSQALTQAYKQSVKLALSLLTASF
jgi:hypothetical protein